VTPPIAKSQLCLAVETGPTARDRLLAALAAAPIASVVLRASAGLAIDPRAAKPLVELLQARGVATLIETDARLARTLRADGVHLTWWRASPDDYRLAREIVGAGGIVGAEAGGSRHAAMELGEAGADYVAFGLADDGERGAAADARDALIEWWSEIFEIPCLALEVADAEDALALAVAGADFLSLSIAAGWPAAEVASRVRAVAAALAPAATVGGAL